MRAYRLIVVALLLTTVLAGGSFTSAQSATAGAAAEDACFAETGFCLRGRFLDYWQANGGLARNGYPLTAERRERLEDGREYTVQYFERVRLELHPENAPPYDVLLGQFGRRVLETGGGVLGDNAARFAPVPPVAGEVFFPETGHNVDPLFFAFWQANGGVAQLGYPIAESRGETVPPGRTLVAQYFERARLEYHPENPPPDDVQLGQLGRQVLGQVDLLAGAFGALYTTDRAVRLALGRPTAPQATVAGATQRFEGGRMFYLPHYTGNYAPEIEALCGDAVRGRWFRRVDTWAEGQPAGGGPAPTPGLYLPRRGFGKAWGGDQRLQSCLGYALTADEQALPLLAQPFSTGLLLADPAGGGIYVLSFAGEHGVGLPGTYERYDAPTR